jgi:hypothetical protein
MGTGPYIPYVALNKALFGNAGPADGETTPVLLAAPARSGCHACQGIPYPRVIENYYLSGVLAYTC